MILWVRMHNQAGWRWNVKLGGLRLIKTRGRRQTEGSAIVLEVVPIDGQDNCFHNVVKKRVEFRFVKDGQLNGRRRNGKTIWFATKVPLIKIRRGRYGNDMDGVMRILATDSDKAKARDKARDKEREMLRCVPTEKEKLLYSLAEPQGPRSVTFLRAGPPPSQEEMIRGPEEAWPFPLRRRPSGQAGSQIPLYQKEDEPEDKEKEKLLYSRSEPQGPHSLTFLGAAPTPSREPREPIEEFPFLRDAITPSRQEEILRGPTEGFPFPLRRRCSNAGPSSFAILGAGA